MAANIGGHQVNKLTEEQCNNPSVENICRKFNINFDFAKLDEREVQAEFKSLLLKSMSSKISKRHIICL